MKKYQHADINNLFIRIGLYDDETAFRELYMQFFTPLVVYAMRYVSVRESCEDIVQGVFLKVWEYRKDLRLDINSNHNSGRNILVTFVKNACIDYIRKSDSRQEYIRKMQEIQTYSKDWVEDLYSVTELESMLSTALDSLPQNLRAVFEMNRFEGKTYAAIAQEKNLSVKTIESYISKVLKILYIELKDYLTIFL